MNISNPDAFQLEAASILATAYEHFPMPIDWNFDTDDERYPTAVGQSRSAIQKHTILWLIRHDYILNKALVTDERAHRILLSERALAVLNSVPDVISGKQPLGTRLVSAVASGSWDVVKQLIPIAIQNSIS